MRIDVEEKSGDFQPRQDTRPRMEEPLPVKLVAVEDVHLPAPPGIDAQLDVFYINLWGFQRDISQPTPTYRAQNLRLIFDIIPEPITRLALRPQTIEIPDLAEAEHLLLDREIDYLRQKGLTPGQESLLLLDPAGNWIELIHRREVM